MRENIFGWRSRGVWVGEKVARPYANFGLAWVLFEAWKGGNIEGGG